MGVNVFDLSGRVALVTGGSRGLGKAMARGLAQAGADIAIASRKQEELDAALPEILDGTGQRGLAVAADLAKRPEAERLARAVLDQLGRVDILINNAGSNIPQPIDEIRDADWDYIIELNLSSAMALSRALIPQMKERRWGRIIHISSIMAIASNNGRDVYSATKAALVALARASALDLGPAGITVNTIAPGPFLTELPARLLSDEQKKRFTDMTALGRWGDPKELVGPALLLASDAGSYITGETLVVDGGYLCR